MILITLAPRKSTSPYILLSSRPQHPKHLTENNPPECSTCFERYHGMCMQGTQCDRCHRETLSHSTIHLLLCPSLLLTILHQTFHRFTRDNNADPGSLSPELHEIFARLHPNVRDALQPRLSLLSDVGQQRWTVQGLGQRYHILAGHL
jgi:hypothetical protein